MKNTITAQSSPKINWNEQKTNTKQEPVRFTDADLYSEESETEALLNSTQIKPIKIKVQENKIF